MNSIYDFIITPKNSRYNNTKKIGDKTLILNTSIEDHKLVSKEAVIVSVPLAFKTMLKPGDEIIVHHNIFRRWYDVIVVNTLKKICIFVNQINYIYIKEKING